MRTVFNLTDKQVAFCNRIAQEYHPCAALPRITRDEWGMLAAILRAAADGVRLRAQQEVER